METTKVSDFLADERWDLEGGKQQEIATLLKNHRITNLNEFKQKLADDQLNSAMQDLVGSAMYVKIVLILTTNLKKPKPPSKYLTGSGSAGLVQNFKQTHWKVINL